MVSLPSHNTQLKERVLWFDGDSTYRTDDLLDLIERYDVRYVDTMNEAVEDYNYFAGPDEQIQLKTECRELDLSWKIPQEYLELNVASYVLNKLAQDWVGSDDELDERLARAAHELKMFEERGLLAVLKTIIYVINTLIENKQVWGVGRGSCVSSYVLYIIGVHDVDSFAYDLEITDFLHD